MTTLNKLLVDVPRFLARCRENGKGFVGVSAVAKQAGIADGFAHPAGFIGTLDALPESVSFGDLRPYVAGETLLLVIESLRGVDQSRLGGIVLLTMANDLFLPHVPVDHPARKPSEALLDSLRDYLLNGANAESYIGAAFRFRSQYGTTISSQDDPFYESLFDAMPASGLCCAVGEGCWHLPMHWASFGRFLVQGRLDQEMLDGIDDALDDTGLLADEEDNAEAVSGVRGILDDFREMVQETALADYQRPLEALLETVLPTAVAHTAQAV